MACERHSAFAQRVDHPDRTPQGHRSHPSSGSLHEIIKAQEVGVFRGSTGAILNVRFSPELGYIVAGGKDGTARMWSLRDLNITK